VRFPAVVLGCALLAGCAPTATPPWTRQPPPPEIDLERPLNAGFLIVDKVYNSELMAPYDIFHHSPFHTKPLPGIEVFTVSPDGEPIVSFEGLTIVPHYGFDDHPPIDILVVPSAEHSMDGDLENEAMMGWVARVGAEASFVMSLCDGAFVLAAAGLLEGRECTTFPGDQDAFAEMFPGLDLQRGVSFVHDGPALTSEGGAKSYDPAIYLVDHLYGEEVARKVGRGLIIDWPPTAEAMPARVVP
jgi:transcriptional regulator GlxA family with amidase domain